ncbi:MAG TPA: helix-turn-helix transcriptional regulator [Vicinamibacterales bacterium]
MGDQPRDPRDLLPLPSHDFQILLSLADAPRHAYGMAKAVQGQTGGVRLEIGSLYRILARLTGDGLIEDFLPAHDAEGHEARRRYYRLTAFGRRVARAEAARLEEVVKAARRQKLLPSRPR